MTDHADDDDHTDADAKQKKQKKTFFLLKCDSKNQYKPKKLNWFQKSI